MIKPISFGGVYKFNAPFDNVERASAYINNHAHKHQQGYPVQGTDEFVFSGIYFNNLVMPASYDDENNENYILTDLHAKKAYNHYFDMIDEWDHFHAYYGVDELTDACCQISQERYQEKVKNIIDEAKEKGEVKELNLEVPDKYYQDIVPPKFSIIG